MEPRINSILRSALDKTAADYRYGLKAFYPTVGSRGINEANLVHVFLMGLRASIPDEHVVTWMESPFLKEDESGKRDRLDGVAYAVESRLLFLIEAKRIKQGKSQGKLNSEKALEQIRADAERMSDPARIKMFRERLPKGDVDAVRVVRVFLADIWPTADAHMQAALDGWRDRTIFPPDWHAGESLISPNVCSDSRYHLLLAAHPATTDLDGCATA